jgi:hypothetical protein
MMHTSLSGFLLTAALFLMSSSAAATWGSNEEQTTLRSQTFDLSRAGAEVTRRLLVTEDRSYSFSLHLSPREGERRDGTMPNWLHSNRNDRTARTELVIPLRLKISVIEAAGERVIVDRELEQEAVDRIRDNAISARIGKIDLQPGFYRLSVQSRKDAPNLAHVVASVEPAWSARSDAASRVSPAMTTLLTQVHDSDLLNHLSSLERLPPGASDKAFLRAESFALPDAIGVLDPCSHRMHLHHESGNFWIVRRCVSGEVSVFQGTQPALRTSPATSQLFAVRRN